MLMGNNLIGFNAFPPNPVLAFLQATSDDSNLTTYSFASQNFGAASLDRYLIATFGWAGNNPTSSSCTIGGIAATKAGEAIPSTSSVGGVAIWIAPVPTGTSGTVAVTLSAGAARMGLSLYAVTGLYSPTATATSAALVAVSGVCSGNIAVQGGGVAIGVTLSVEGVAGFTWSGLTENADLNLEAGSGEYSSASGTFATAQGALSWSAADGASATRSPVGVVASFR